MIDSRRTVLFGFMTSMSLAVLFLFVLAPVSPDFYLLVTSSNGGTVQRGDDVMLRGEPITSLDTVRVFRGKLELRSRGQQFKMSFDPGSRIRFDRVYSDTPFVRLTVLNGSGTVAVNQGQGTVRYGDGEVSIDQGILHWSLDGETMAFRRSRHFQGYLPPETHGQNNKVGTFPHSPRLDWRDEPPPEKKEQWHVGSLMSGRAVERAIKQFVKRTQRRPRDLRDVFGYWVRDRWGQVFLYRTEDNQFEIVSGGPDQAILTDDDRIWRGKWPN